MLTKSYTNRYIIVLICFCFSLWIQESQTAAKAVTYAGIGSSEGKEALSQEEQKNLLKHFITKGLPQGITASEVIGIIRQSGKAEVVKEISPLEKQLTDIERRLNSSLFVSQNDLKQIASELSGSIQQQFQLSDISEDQRKFLHDKIIALTRQVKGFISFMGLEEYFQNSLQAKDISYEIISDKQKELENIKKETEGQFYKNSSFNKRIIELENVLKDREYLLKQDENTKNVVVKTETYLMALEDVLKKDDIKPEIVQVIRVRLNKIVDTQKLNFPASQQSIITKRINNLEQLLDIFDYLLPLQTVVTQKDLSLTETEKIASGLRNTQKELEQLGLAKDLSNSVTKHLARVNNQLVPKLFEFLDQLARSAEAISTLDHLKEVENQFKLLQKLRKNLDLTKDQEGDIDKKFAEVESLLNQRRDPLLEQQKRNEELERIAQEQERAQQIELQKQKEQQELQERERQEVQERERVKREEEQKKEQERIEKLNARKDAIEKVEKKTATLIPELVQLGDDWRNAQDQETRLRSSFYKRIEKPTAKEQERLKRMAEALEQKKNFMTVYADRVTAIHNEIARLYKESSSDKEDLIPLLNKWVRALLDLRQQLVKESQTLLMQTNQKKREQKSFLKGFIERNEIVMNDIDALIILVDKMRIADDNKLVLIEEAIKERDRPKKAPKPKRQGPFSRYF